MQHLVVEMSGSITEEMLRDLRRLAKAWDEGCSSTWLKRDEIVIWQVGGWNKRVSGKADVAVSEWNERRGVIMGGRLCERSADAG